MMGRTHPDQSSEKKKKTKANHKLTPPQEIVIHEIFLRLPATSVIRLSSACKSWRSSTARDPPFLTAHRSQTQTSWPSSCFILKSFLYAQMTRINVSHDSQEIAIQEEDMEMAVHKENFRPTDLGSLCLVASCDNLLCLVSNRLNYYYLHNLSTREWIIVPRVGRGHLFSFLRAFYYHPSTGEYRLLSWFKMMTSSSGAANPRQQPPLPSTFGVFSLKLASKWRLIDAQPPPPSHCPVDLSRLTQGHGRFQPRATAHGNVHWAPMSDYPWILAFEVETENFRQLDIPRRLRQQHQDSESGALDFDEYHVLTLGHELVLSYTRGAYELELWLLKDYKYKEECWVKLHTISIPSIVNAMSSGDRVERRYVEEFFQPVGLCSAPTYGEDLLVLRYNARVFTLYNLVSKRIKWVTAKQFCGVFVALLTETLPCLLHSFN